MNKCPKCNNEKVKESQNFCQVCGVKLNMSKEDAIVSLKRLLDVKGIILPNERQALEYAIKELERTAQEVPVQEQSNKLHLFVVKNNSIQLDYLTLKGVISYTLQKTSRLDLEELTLKMQVCKTKIDF